MLRRTLDVPVPGKRRRGRQKTRWKDLCKRDTESVGLKEEEEEGIALHTLRVFFPHLGRVFLVPLHDVIVRQDHDMTLAVTSLWRTRHKVNKQI